MPFDSDTYAGRTFIADENSNNEVNDATMALAKKTAEKLSQHAMLENGEQR